MLAATLFGIGIAVIAGCGGGGGGSQTPPVALKATPSPGPITITEYVLPSTGNFGVGPWGITTGADGGVWYLDHDGAPTEGRIDPTTHAIAQYRAALPSPQPYVNCGQGLASGSDGGLWGAFMCGTADPLGPEENDGAIARFDPTTHAVQQYSITGNYACPGDIASGPDGRMWFTLQCQGLVGIGAINEQTGAITYWQLPSDPACSTDFPNGMTLGPDGAMWFGISGYPCAAPGFLARIAPSTGVITTVPIPAGAYSCPYSIVTGPDRALWFTLACNPGGIGRYDPVKKTFNEYPLITQNTQPHEIVAGADSALYFGEWNAAKIGRITLTGTVTEYVMPTQAYTYGFTLGPDNAVWFTETTANQIGRIK